MLLYTESHHAIHSLVYMFISFIRVLPHCLFVLGKQYSWKVVLVRG